MFQVEPSMTGDKIDLDAKHSRKHDAGVIGHLNQRIAEGKERIFRHSTDPGIKILRQRCGQTFPGLTLRASELRQNKALMTCKNNKLWPKRERRL